MDIYLHLCLFDGGGRMSTQKHAGSIKSYTIGFALSIILTLIPFGLVMNGNLTGFGIVSLLVMFALAQLLVQTVFFLHIGNENGPRLNLLTYLFMLLVVVIVVIGSLWIMANLDYNMMPHDMEHELLKDEGIHNH